MHLKTNIETSLMHIVILAICPLLLVMQTATQSLYFIVSTLVCYVVAAIVGFLLSKYLSRTIKVFVTALLSTFIITLASVLMGDTLAKLNVSETALFFSVISAIVLSVDAFYIDTKASTNTYILKVLATAVSFAILSLFYAIIKEIFGFGTFFGLQIQNFFGIEFCRTIIFDFILLGTISIIAEIVARAINKHFVNEKISYQKFVRLIRDEKEFQYDSLRRNKLLTSAVEINKIGNDEYEEILDKTNQNEVGVEQKSQPEEEPEPEKKKRKKKNKRLKFSKETKTEKVFDQQQKQDEGDE